MKNFIERLFFEKVAIFIIVGLLNSTLSVYSAPFTHPLYAAGQSAKYVTEEYHFTVYRHLSQLTGQITVSPVVIVFEKCFQFNLDILY